ncbi:MAG: radical SAM protein, partial [bacterium]
RSDLVQIVETALKYLHPAIVHIPTNALAPGIIESGSREILQMIRNRQEQVIFSVKPSIDGVGAAHDRIRGVPGNFAKLEETINRLKLVESDYPEFNLELGTVISKYNVDVLDEIENYVHNLGVQSYRNEIAEERAEFFNRGDGITPNPEIYERMLKRFSQEILRHLDQKKSSTQLIEALRLTYYDLAVRILKEKRQVLPCFGGISNLHLNFDGELWPCCVLAYDYPLANLRESGYDVQAAMQSDQAKKVLAFVKNRGCYCPLANQWYSNILLHPPTILRVISHHFFIDNHKKNS